MVIKGKISRFQLFVLVFIFMIGNTILNAPSIIVTYAKQDAWISGILALMIGIGLVLLFVNLSAKFPNKTIVQYIEILLGKKVGKTVSILLIFYFFLLSTLVSRQLGDFILTYILPETPIVFIYFLFLFVVVMGAYLGLETLARSGELFFPFLLVLLIFLFLILTKEKDIGYLKPFLEGGIGPVFSGAFTFIGIPYLQLIVFLMILPDVEKSNKNMKLPFLLGVSIAGLFLIISILHSLLIIGPILTEYKQYPIYFLTQKISIGDIIQRIEVLLAITWFITIFFKASILLYATNLGLIQIFKLKNTGENVIPLGLLLFILVQIISPNIVYFDNFFKVTFPSFALTFGFILPFILMVMYFIKRRHLNRDMQ
jgi:spore germination protein KB